MESAHMNLTALLQAQAYAHPVRDLRAVETHISWVLLTGDYAYKIKKPVNLGFVDFSTLELRRHACQDELRLNRRYAPQLYLDVVPITGSGERPRVGGTGEPFEYAVKMSQFAQDQQLDRLLDAGRLGMHEMDTLGEAIGALHAAAPVAGAGSPYGWPARIQRDAQDNLDALRAGTDDALRASVAELLTWTHAQNHRLLGTMHARRSGGHVREVHGDLHLANLVRLGAAIVPFDCIEFNEALRWNDTISDLAFLTMDLRARRRPDLAYRVLGRYLEVSGDYAGLRLLRYYEVYRALVRAKVALIRRDGSAGAEHAAQQRELERYLALARALAAAERRALVLMHGLSGSGKTWLSTRLSSALPAVRTRSDLERKRLHGLGEAERSASAVNAGIYSAQASAQTYERLAVIAQEILDAGETAIVDAAFLRRAERARFRELARELAVPLAIVSCSAPHEKLRRRVELRAQRGADASEADREVLEHQFAAAEPLGDDERPGALQISTADCTDVTAVALRLQHMLFT
ncbi:MAG: AAA family ATPase [Gammaproteobacteria bacterium]